MMSFENEPPIRPADDPKPLSPPHQTAATIPSSRLHWSSLGFDVISHVWGYIIPVGIALLGAAKGNFVWMFLAGFFFSFSLARSVFRYFTLNYRLDGRRLVVQQGLVFRSIRTVPVQRIQNIDLVQNPLHRLLQVAEVRIDTASGSEPEAVLRVISLEQVEKLRKEIFGLQEQMEVNPHHSLESNREETFDRREDECMGLNPDGDSKNRLSGDAENDFNGNTTQHSNVLSEQRPPWSHARNRQAAQTLISLPSHWLVLAGLASNRGWIIVGVMIGLFYQFNDSLDWLKRLDIKKLRQWFPENLDHLTTIAVIAVAFIAIMLFLKVLGMVWYLLRFYGYQLRRRGDDLQISCGLFTRVSATIPRPRIQLISIHQTLILRWLGFSSIRIETAGLRSNQQADESVSERWFLPVVKDNRVIGLLAEIRPTANYDFDTLDKLNWTVVAKRAVGRRLRLTILEAIIPVVVGGYLWQPWGALVGASAWPMLLYWRWRQVKSIRFALFPDGFVYQSGVLTRQTSFTFFEKIQGIAVLQTPFDRRWKMAKLVVDTAGVGPAEHTLQIPLVDYQQALDYQHKIKRASANHQLVVS